MCRLNICLHGISLTETNTSLALDFFFCTIWQIKKSAPNISLKAVKNLDVEVCVSVLALKISKNSFILGISI